MRSSVQVWTSYFWKSPFDEAHLRDLRRAQRQWRGEHRIYLDKDAKVVTRWSRIDHGMQVIECVVPSETVNCFAISHIDGQGRVYPYIPIPDAWHESVSGSYIRWLKESAKLYLVKSEYTHMPMPVIKDGKVSIIEADITLRPGPVASIVDFNNDGIMTINFERPGNAEMLAPNQEIEAVQGKPHYERQELEGHEWLFAVPEKGPPLLGISMQMGWEKPFSYFLGEGGGIDLAMHQGLFKRCIGDLQDGNNAKAMMEAETWLGVLTSTGKTSLWHSWFAPMAQANQQQALFAVETQYNISANSVKNSTNLKSSGKS